VSVWHAVVLSLLQGAFELFPVSSLGHTVLVPALLDWNERQSDPSFLAFVVVLHLGTALALLLFFWRDWMAVIGAVVRSIARRRLSADADERLGWLIVAGSIPAGILGLLFKQRLNDLFDHPWLVAVFLVANGFVLLAGERLRAMSANRPDGADIPLAELGLARGFGIGTVQALALLPGFSRSGTTMVGGLVTRLSHVNAARLSFMLATPLIFAAGVLSLPDLFKDDANIGPGIAAMGFVISGVTAFLAVRFLMRYFTTDRLDVFGYYCIAFGVLAFGVLGFRGF
jgi:undecaprenyl-diphosphatase